MDPALIKLKWSNDLEFPIYDWHFYYLLMPDADGATEVHGLLHPDSLTSERVRVIIEFRAIEATPILEFTWLNGIQYDISHSKIVADDPDWSRMIVSAPRIDGQPFGPGADMFEYRNRGLEVRRFVVEDYGIIGDANLDGVVNGTDLGIVIDNIGSTQNPEIIDGDLNADGLVDIFDLFPVIEEMSIQN